MHVQSKSELPVVSKKCSFDSGYKLKVVGLLLWNEMNGTQRVLIEEIQYMGQYLRKGISGKNTIIVLAMYAIS